MSLPSWSDVEKSARVMSMGPGQKAVLHKFYEAEWKREQREKVVKGLLKFLGSVLLGALILYAFMQARVLLP